MLSISGVNDCEISTWLEKRMIMNAATKSRLWKLGWKVGSVSDFLLLRPEEVSHIEWMVRFVKAVTTRRRKVGTRRGDGGEATPA